MVVKRHQPVAVAMDGGNGPNAARRAQIDEFFTVGEHGKNL